MFQFFRPIFVGSRLPFVTALRFMYDWSLDEISYKHNKTQFKMSYQTSADWRNYMREICIEAISSTSVGSIGGADKIVEIDESLFSRRKSHKGRLLPEQWIFGGISREDKKCFIVKVRL